MADLQAVDVAAVIRDHSPTFRVIGNRLGGATSMNLTACSCGADIGPDGETWPEHVAELVARAQLPWPLLTSCHGAHLWSWIPTGIAQEPLLACTAPGCPNLWSARDGLPLTQKRPL